VADGFTQAGGQIRRVAGTNGRGDHLVASSPWGGDGPGVLVLCHLDTVHPKGTLERLPFRVEGDKAYGPGIYDMKGGAYLAFAAFAALAADPRRPEGMLPVRVVYTSDEEVGSQTSRALVEAEAANARHVLVVEPARGGGRIVTARKGTARFEIVTHGRPSHSGTRPQDGRSAIIEMARQIVDIESWTDFKQGTTLNVGTIEGGTATNVVPARCTASLDLRVPTLADAERIMAQLGALKPYNPDVRIEITGGLNRPPFEKNAGVAGLFDHAAGLARQIGFELRDMYAGGGSDANFTAHAVPTLDGLGVDGAGAHTEEEHLYVSSLVPRARLLRDLMATLE
jgi:glutamate carboxypeptidase